MKLHDANSNEPKDASARKLRMETLLFAWRIPPYWLERDGVDSPVDPSAPATEGDDWDKWIEIVRAADVVPPRTHIVGLETHQWLKGLDGSQLAREGVIRIIGSRVATRWIDGPSQLAAQLGGYGWSLLIRAANVAMSVDECERILSQRFREVAVFGAVLLASDPRGGKHETATILVSDVLATKTFQDALEKAWGLSVAVGVDDAFVDQLPKSFKAALAAALRTELLSDVASVGIEADVSLAFFAEGIADAALDDVLPPIHLPSCRLASLLQSASSSISINP